MRGRRLVVVAVALLVSACGGAGSAGTASLPNTASPPPQASSDVTAVPSVVPTSGSRSAPVPSGATATTRTPTGSPTATRTRPSRPTGTAAAEQVEKALEDALEVAVESAVEVALADAGITLSSGPDCKADLALDADGRTASGKVRCTGTTTAGLAVTATFTGSVSAGGSCEGRLLVTVGGRTVVDEPVDSCSVSIG